MAGNNVITLALGVLLCVAVASAVKCYSCDNCEDVGSSTGTCEGSYCIMWKGSSGGQTGYSRDCWNTGPTGCESVEANGGKATQCICDDKDLCNGARAQVGSVLAVLLTALAAWLAL